MIIAFANQKGGVGKTTTALSLASILAKKGNKILAVDLDPQANFTSGLGYRRRGDYLSTYDVLIQEVEIADATVDSEIANLSLVPSKIDLAASEIELVSKLSRERILKNRIDKVVKDYDYVFIDCPPSLGLLTINAFAAADQIVIPVQCEYFALEGITQLLNTVNLVKKNLNPSLDIFGVVMTMFDARTKLSVEVVEEIKKYFSNKLFNTIIPRNVTISESPSHGKPIDMYDPSSIGAKAYTALADEFAHRMSKNN